MMILEQESQQIDDGSKSPSVDNFLQDEEP
jgi:hypothetical protein